VEGERETDLRFATNTTPKEKESTIICQISDFSYPGKFFSHEKRLCNTILCTITFFMLPLFYITPTRFGVIIRHRPVADSKFVYNIEETIDHNRRFYMLWYQ
jgi:hypothetical protein